MSPSPMHAFKLLYQCPKRALWSTAITIHQVEVWNSPNMMIYYNTTPSRYPSRVLQNHTKNLIDLQSPSFSLPTYICDILNIKSFSTTNLSNGVGCLQFTITGQPPTSLAVQTYPTYSRPDSESPSTPPPPPPPLRPIQVLCLGCHRKCVYCDVVCYPFMHVP